MAVEDKVYAKELLNLGTVEIGNLKLQLVLTNVVLTSFVAVIVIAFFSYIFTRNMSIKNPSMRQLFIETLIVTIAKQIRAMSNMPIFPFFGLIATMWILISFSNLIGIIPIPIFHTPTADLSAVAGLSTITFLSIYYFGVRYHGISYFKEFFEPVFFFFPFHVVGEFGRIVSLTFRLFGNMLGWDLIIAILVYLTGLLIPVPAMLFHIFEALLQAYIFGLLTLAYIVSGLKVEELEKRFSNIKEDWYET